jgi:hypothetical protein
MLVSVITPPAFPASTNRRYRLLDCWVSRSRSVAQLCSRLPGVTSARKSRPGAAGLAWVLRARPLCSGALISGWQRGLRLGFGEVCGPTGQQVPRDQHQDDHGHHAGLVPLWLAVWCFALHGFPLRLARSALPGAPLDGRGRKFNLPAKAAGLRHAEPRSEDAARR